MSEFLFVASVLLAFWIGSGAAFATVIGTCCCGIFLPCCPEDGTGSYKGPVPGIILFSITNESGCPCLDGWSGELDYVEDNGVCFNSDGSDMGGWFLSEPFEACGEDWTLRMCPCNKVGFPPGGAAGCSKGATTTPTNHGYLITITPTGPFFGADDEPDNPECTCDPLTGIFRNIPLFVDSDPLNVCNGTIAIFLSES